MPLTSKDNGPELKPGDYVKMPWVVARILPNMDVVMLTRQGGTGGVSVSPQTVVVRMGIGTAAIKIIPATDTLREGARCLLLWQVSQVYPSSGTVLARRDGVGGSPAALTTIMATAGALASELEYVPPGDVKPPKPPGKPFVSTLELEPAALKSDFLPYLLDIGTYNWPSDGYGPALPGEPLGVPIVTALVPDQAALGAPSFTLRVMGSGFSSDAVIHWNGSPEPTTVVSSTEVTTAVNMATATVAVPVPVLVQTAAGASNTLIFTLTEPVPGTTSGPLC